MADTHLQRFDEVIDRIDRQQEFGLSCYAFLSGIVGNSDRHARYNHSYAGRALDLCIRSVQTSLVLFCSRHWDEGDDLQSIPTARAHAECALDEIVRRHREFFVTHGIERDAQEFYDYFEDLSSDVRNVEASPTQSKIRILRTENYAHLTTKSRDRDKALSMHSDFDMDDLTINSLLVFTQQTIELSNRLLYLKERLFPKFDEQVAHRSGYYDKFWDNLPVFSEVEAPL